MEIVNESADADAIDDGKLDGAPETGLGYAVPSTGAWCSSPPLTVVSCETGASCGPQRLEFMGPDRRTGRRQVKMCFTNHKKWAPRRLRCRPEALGQLWAVLDNENVSDGARPCPE